MLHRADRRPGRAESLNMGEVVRADIYDAISDGNIPWDRLRDSTVLVTGATGLVGSALVRTLASANTEYGLNTRLIGHGRDADKGEALARELQTEHISGDIRKLSSIANIAERLDYIIHCAAVTKSADMAAKPAEVMTTAADGTKNILDLAPEKQCLSFVYISSMEIYGQTELSEVSEGDLGYLDLSGPRSCYPESKRFCETLCLAYARQYGFRAKAARLAQTFGAGTPKDDTRVFAQFARSAIENRDIELHTEGETRGNYFYISDTVRGLLTILLKGEGGEAYNIANPEAGATVREMAELVADKICNGKINVAVKAPEDIEKLGYAPHSGFTLNADKLKALGWSPKYGLEEMYRRMIADWRGR